MCCLCVVCFHICSICCWRVRGIVYTVYIRFHWTMNTWDLRLEQRFIYFHSFISRTIVNWRNKCKRRPGNHCALHHDANTMQRMLSGCVGCRLLVTQCLVYLVCLVFICDLRKKINFGAFIEIDILDWVFYVFWNWYYKLSIIVLLFNILIHKQLMFL